MTDGAAFAARCLLRAARAGTLATQSGGQPFASLVTPATAPDGDVLLLLSALSAHTRHLVAEPRCALMVAGVAEGTNPQTAPRLTVTGRAAPEPDPRARTRWLARHRHAAEYAGFTDFSVWRIRVQAGHFVAGFARAHALAADALHSPGASVEAIRAGETGVLGRFNSGHEAALARIARQHGHPDTAVAWRMGAADPDGIDLASDDAVVRVAFDRPVASAAELRSAVERLIGRATDEHEGPGH